MFSFGAALLRQKSIEVRRFPLAAAPVFHPDKKTKILARTVLRNTSRELFLLVIYLPLMEDWDSSMIHAIFLIALCSTKGLTEWSKQNMQELLVSTDEDTS